MPAAPAADGGGGVDGGTRAFYSAGTIILPTGLSTARFASSLLTVHPFARSTF